MTFSNSYNWGKTGNPTYSGASLGVGSDGATTAMTPSTESATTTKPCGCKEAKNRMYYHVLLGALIGGAIVYFYKK